VASQVGSGTFAALAGPTNIGFNELAAMVATPVASQVIFFLLFISFP
jgi:hypothetical protein